MLVPRGFCQDYHLPGAYVAGHERMEPKSSPGVVSTKRLVLPFPQSPKAAPGSRSRMFGYIYMWTGAFQKHRTPYIPQNTMNSYLKELSTKEAVENPIWIAGHF